MILSKRDSRRFYNIWFNLLDHVNEKLQMDPERTDLAHAESVDPAAIQPIRDRLWEDVSLVQSFVNENPGGLSDEDLAVAESWKTRVTGKFILLKHLKRQSIFLSEEKVYGVIGIVSPFEEMFPADALPIMMKAVLIPFEGKIIYDSLLLPYSIHFGGGIRKRFREDYRRLKEKDGVITSLG